MKYFVLISTLLIPFYLFGQNQKPKADITIPELTQHISVLASDSLGGRKPGDPGCDKAAHYIAAQMEAYHLKPVMQPFEVITNISLGKNNSFTVDTLNAVVSLDFTPMSFSASGNFSGEMAFCGFGMDVKFDSMAWNAYEKADVKGKWALILRHDPEPDDPNSKFLPYSDDRTKAIMAKEHGAIGVILVSGVKSDDKDLLAPLHYDQTPADAGIPVIQVTRRVANYLLAGTDHKIEDLEKQIITEKRPFACALVKKLKVNVEVIPTRVTTSNVYAILEGSDSLLKKQFIVVGAHYDHLGMGGEGSGSRNPDTLAVHNGADDNASGVAGVIEMIGKFNNSHKPLRSMIFIAFSAEEMGLIGSKYFVDHLPVAKNQIAAMINFDMIGRMNPEDHSVSISGTGTALEFENMLQPISCNRDLKSMFIADGYGPSDHSTFYTSNIPVLYFTTGAHDDYHTPADDADKINYQGEKMVCDLASDMIRCLTDTLKVITYKESATPVQARYGRRLKITLGIIPNMTSSANDGLGVDGVRKGGPAEKGGILKGDRIIAIDGNPVTNIYDYMFRLGKLQAGKTCNVEVIRNNERKILLIQL